MAKIEKMRVASPHVHANLPALDVDFLNIATFNDIGLRTEIITLFRQQVKTLADQLALAPDGKSWSYMTHTLKGSASAVGACQLAAIADDWEMAGFPSSRPAQLVLVTHLEAALLAFNSVADRLTSA